MSDDKDLFRKESFTKKEILKIITETTMLPPSVLAVKDCFLNGILTDNIRSEATRIAHCSFLIANLFYASRAG